MAIPTTIPPARAEDSLDASVEGTAVPVLTAVELRLRVTDCIRLCVLLSAIVSVVPADGLGGVLRVASAALFWLTEGRGASLGG